MDCHPTDRQLKKISWPLGLSIEDGLLPMDIAIVFEWFAQESVFAAELTHEQPQREIWIRLAEMWASAAARCRHEEGAIGEDAAVYLSGAPAGGQSEHRLSQPESF